MERRKYRRAEMNYDGLVVINGELIVAGLMDMSQNGALINLGKYTGSHVGKDVKVCFYDKPTDVLGMVNSKVVRQFEKNGNVFIGVSFADNDASVISVMTARFQKERAIGRHPVSVGA